MFTFPHLLVFQPGSVSTDGYIAKMTNLHYLTFENTWKSFKALIPLVAKVGHGEILEKEIDQFGKSDLNKPLKPSLLEYTSIPPTTVL